MMCAIYFMHSHLPISAKLPANRFIFKPVVNLVTIIKPSKELAFYRVCLMTENILY